MASSYCFYCHYYCYYKKTKFKNIKENNINSGLSIKKKLSSKWPIEYICTKPEMTRYKKQITNWLICYALIVLVIHKADFVKQLCNE